LQSQIVLGAAAAVLGSTAAARSEASMRKRIVRGMQGVIEVAFPRR
jgi:VIT1/CCC1 family predicted Fe2+/Mn2+ transporter